MRFNSGRTVLIYLSFDVVVFNLPFAEGLQHVEFVLLFLHTSREVSDDFVFTFYTLLVCVQQFLHRLQLILQGRHLPSVPNIVKILQVIAPENLSLMVSWAYEIELNLLMA